MGFKSLLFIGISLFAGSLSASELSLEGTFFRPCWEGAKGFHNQETMTFGNNLTVGETHYPFPVVVVSRQFTVQPTCGELDVEFRGIAEVKFSSKPFEAQPGAFEIDAKWLVVEVRPLSTTITDNFNKTPGGMCGLKDWKVKEFKDVSGSICEGIIPPKKNYGYHQIYKLGDENAIKNPHPTYKTNAPRVVFGDDTEIANRNKLNGTKPELRPQTLDPKAVYFLVDKMPEGKDRPVEPLKSGKKRPRAVLGGN